jgi:adenosine/AMP kinase
MHDYYKNVRTIEQTVTSEDIHNLDLRQLFGFKWGIKLAAASSQRLIMRIRDDCTDPDLFDVIAYGFDNSKPQIENI